MDHYKGEALRDKRHELDVGRIILLVAGAWLLWPGLLAVGVLALGGKVSAETLGQAGDLFGGINALFTALAFAAVWWSGWMQRKELELQRNELQLQRDELSQTRAVFERQTFESMFFQQIGLLRDLARSVEIIDRVGPKAWGIISGRCVQLLEGKYPYGVDTSKQSSYESYIEESYYDEVYAPAEPTLGPYYRVLYHIYRLIDEQVALSKDDKVRYANLARAQLGSAELIALAANAMTKRAEEFRPLIARYGILKHLPMKPWVRRLEQKLSPTAFMSRSGREAFWAKS